MSPDNLKAFIEAVEKLAFEMPPPNPYTPRFVELCIAARALSMLSREPQLCEDSKEKP